MLLLILETWNILGVFTALGELPLFVYVESYFQRIETVIVCHSPYQKLNYGFAWLTELMMMHICVFRQQSVYECLRSFPSIGHITAWWNFLYAFRIRLLRSYFLIYSFYIYFTKLTLCYTCGLSQCFSLFRWSFKMFSSPVHVFIVFAVQYFSLCIVPHKYCYSL